MTRGMRWTVLTAALCLCAQVAAQDDGGTPLHRAARAGDTSAIKTLLDGGVDPNLTDAKGSTALHVLAADGQRTADAIRRRSEAARTLLDAGADVNAADRGGMTALHIALARQRVELIGVLLDAGADVNAKDAHQRRPLYYAALSDNTKAIGRLVASGAAINAIDAAGNTALHAAAMRFRVNATAILLSRGADPNASNANDETPLHSLATAHLNAPEPEVLLAKAAELLIEGGAEVNQRAKDGSTPLTRAIEGRHSELVRLLVKKGGTK